MNPASNNSQHESIILREGRDMSYELGNHIKKTPTRSNRTNSRPSPPNGVNWRDLLLILLRHRWVIILLSVIGFGAAAGVYFTQELTYRSTAKLMVNYIMKRGALDSFETRSSTEGRLAENLLFGELQILQSIDTAKSAAQTLGPDILTEEERSQQNEPLLFLSGKISSGLNAFVVYNTNILEVSYDGDNPEASKTVLESVIQNYLKRHLEIHRSFGASKAIEERLTTVKGKLETIESELQSLKKEEGVISLLGTSTALEEQRTQIAKELLDAETTLASEEAKSNVYKNHDSAVSAAILAQTGSTASHDPVSSDVILKYEDLARQLESKVKARDERLLTYTDIDYLVIKLDRDIKALNAERQSLVSNYPALLTTQSLESNLGIDTSMSDSELQEAQLLSSRARLAKLKEHASHLEQRFAEWASISSKITELERQYAHQNENYALLEKNLEKARVDETIDSSRLTNIHIIQTPSDAIPVQDELTKKLVLGLAASGLLLGVGFAFIMELFVDRRVKEPSELPMRLNVPLLLSIPELRLATPASPKLTRAERAQKLIPHPTEFPVTISDRESFRPWAEAIRNRLLFSYDVYQITHKPKLIGVTSASKGAGSTILSTSLADVFSDIDDSKVLYIDLSKDEDVIAWETKPTPALENAQERRKGELTKEKSSSRFTRAQLPKFRSISRNNRPLLLRSLLPTLQESDYDYIIFDMPELHETSPTFALASMMDQILLVLSAQNTSRDSLKRYYAEIEKSNPNVSCIFNKTRITSPSWLIE